MNLITITDEQEALIRRYTNVEVNVTFTLDLDSVPEEHTKFIETIVGTQKLNRLPNSTPTVDVGPQSRRSFNKTSEKLTINRFGLDEDITYKNGSGEIVKLWNMYNFLMNDYEHGEHTTRTELLRFFKRHGDNHSQASAHVLALVKKGAIVEGHVPKHNLKVGSLGCIAIAA